MCEASYRRLVRRQSHTLKARWLAAYPVSPYRDRQHGDAITLVSAPPEGLSMRR